MTRFDPAALMALTIPDTHQSYGWRDAALYALGVGAGLDPLDPATLGFVDERRLRVLPSFASVLGCDGFWAEQMPTGIDLSGVLHGEQELETVAPLPVQATIRRATRILGVLDRGAGKGAFVRVSETVHDISGALLAEMRSTVVCRREGGLGGTIEALPPPHCLPDRAPDRRIGIPGWPQQALLYRLSGDLNPLHIDPGFARRAGFPRPIVHGLASFGTVCRVLIETLRGGDPAPFRTMKVRFAGALYPGEATELALWLDAASRVGFRLRATERDVVILDNGLATFAA